MYETFSDNKLTQGFEKYMCKIVIVDEREDVLNTYKQDLLDLFPTHSVYTFRSTKEALEEVKKLEYIEILIFNSLTEDAELSGIEFAKHIRKDSPQTMMFYTEEDVIVKIDHLLKLSDIGIDGYINLPYNKKFLKVIIKNSLSRLKTFQRIKTVDHIQLVNSVHKVTEKWDMFFNNQVKHPSAIKQTKFKKFISHAFSL